MNKKTIAIIIIIVLIGLIYIVEARKNSPATNDGILPATNTYSSDTGTARATPAESDLEAQISAGATGNEQLPAAE